MCEGNHENVAGTWLCGESGWSADDILRVCRGTLKVGLTLSITGPASPLGDPEKKVIELYADKINKAGGVAGKKERTRRLL